MQWYERDLTLYQPPGASYRCRKSRVDIIDAQRKAEYIMQFDSGANRSEIAGGRFAEDIDRLQRSIAQHKVYKYSTLNYHDLEHPFAVNTNMFDSFKNADADFYKLYIEYYEYLKRNLRTVNTAFDSDGLVVEIAINDEIFLELATMAVVRGVLEFYNASTGDVIHTVDLGEYYYVLINRQAVYAYLGKQLRAEDRVLIIEYFECRSTIVCASDAFRRLLSLL